MLVSLRQENVRKANQRALREQIDIQYLLVFFRRRREVMYKSFAVSFVLILLIAGAKMGEERWGVKQTKQGLVVQERSKHDSLVVYDKVTFILRGCLVSGSRSCFPLVLSR